MHKLLTQDIIFILNLLESHGFSIMLVGGCVRDYLCFQNINFSETDIDMATDAQIDDLTAIFNANNMQYIATGKSYGTITLIYGNKHYQITTLRRDIKTYGRKADVIYTSSFQQDSMRRDFTINALYMDKNGTIHDYHNGMEDLKNGIIKFIGNPEERIKEDYLRILRYFRFLAKFSNKNINNEYLKIIKSNLSGISYVSGERIISELLKIFNNQKIYSDKYSICIFDTLNYLFGIQFDLIETVNILKINKYLNNYDIIGLLLMFSNKEHIKINASSLPKRISKCLKINLTNNKCIDFRITLKNIHNDYRMFAMCWYLIFLYTNRLCSLGEAHELKADIVDFLHSRYSNFTANHNTKNAQDIINDKNIWKQRVF